VSGGASDAALAPAAASNTESGDPMQKTNASVSPFGPALAAAARAASTATVSIFQFADLFADALETNATDSANGISEFSIKYPGTWCQPIEPTKRFPTRVSTSKDGIEVVFRVDEFFEGLEPPYTTQNIRNVFRKVLSSIGCSKYRLIVLGSLNDIARDAWAMEMKMQGLAIRLACTKDELSYYSLRFFPYLSDPALIPTALDAVATARAASEKAAQAARPQPSLIDAALVAAARAAPKGEL